MKTIRKDWPKVREYLKGEEKYFSVDMRRRGFTGPSRKGFNDREKALNYAKEISARVNRGELTTAHNILDPRVARWTERAALLGKTIEEIFELGLSVVSNQAVIKTSPFVSELMTLWVDDRKNDTLEPVRPRSLGAIKSNANLFTKDFGGKKLVELNEAFCEEYLRNLPVSNTTRANRKTYLSGFFGWAIKKKYCSDNPVRNITIRKTASTGAKIFTLEQCAEIMRVSLQTEHKAVSNYFALCLFGGIRPEEVERMTWDDINFDTKEIRISAEISKTKSNRLFKGHDSLFTWLNHNKNEKPLIPCEIRNKKSDLFKALSFPWIQDGLRHTFASYHYAEHHDIEELRHCMGNSPSILNRHYLKAITANDVCKFWSITPESVIKAA